MDGSNRSDPSTGSSTLNEAEQPTAESTTAPQQSDTRPAAHSEPRVTIIPPADHEESDDDTTQPHSTSSKATPERREREREREREPRSQAQPPSAMSSRPTPTRRQSSHRRTAYSVDDNEDEVLEDERWGQQRPVPNVRTMSTGFNTRKGMPGASLRRRTTGGFAPAVPEATEESILSPSRQQSEPLSDSEEEDEGAVTEAEDPEFLDDEETVDDGDQTLKERQEAINVTHPFGIKIWKSSLYKKDRSVQRMAEAEVHSSPGTHVGNFQQIGNVLWTIIFGWWLAAIALVGAFICLITLSRSGREYATIFWGLSKYFFYPFGRYVQLRQDAAYLEEDEGEGRDISEYEQWQAGDIEEGRLFFGPRTPHPSISRTGPPLDSISEVESLSDSGDTNERTGLLSNNEEHISAAKRRRFFGRGKWNIGRVTFYTFYYLIIAPILLLTCMVCWLLVFTIPMARVATILLSHLRRHPLALSFHSSETHHLRSNNQAPVLVCTYRAMGWKYYKYTIDGTNIFIINLMAIVVFVVLDYWILHKVIGHNSFLTSPSTLFILALLSIIPLAYFIGLAVASVSAQSSMGLASVLNAFFSTIVEVFLYCVALRQGKSRLVEGSIVGSILAGILLMPGLSMCAGTVFRKTQHFNDKSAEATMTMLLFAVIGAFAPTLFYQIYGTYELKCRDCEEEAAGSRLEDCRRCYFSQPPSIDDPFYKLAVEPFCYAASFLLVVSYIIGCLFTLKTHAQLIWQQPEKVQTPHPARPPSRANDSTTNVRIGMPTRFHGPVQESPIYKQVLDRSLNSTGLVKPPNPSAPGVLQLPPPPENQENRSLPLTPQSELPHLPHQKPLASLSTEENESLIRGVAEMVALAATTSVSAVLREAGSSSTSDVAKKSITSRVSDANTQMTASHTTANHASQGGHDAPNWSRFKSLVILCGATVLYAAVAEILVSTVDVVLDNANIDEKFLGITLFALVPNTTEFLNAISFAMNGNVALSMEIGSAYALQVVLLQMPALVAFTAFTISNIPHQDLYAHMFTLIFPQWDMVTVILCVLMLTNIIHEGKSNYFKGSFLCLSYIIVMLGFYFSGSTDIGNGVNERAQFFDALSRGKGNYFVGSKYGHPSNGGGFTVQ